MLPISTATRLILDSGGTVIAQGDPDLLSTYRSEDACSVLTDGVNSFLSLSPLWSSWVLLDVAGSSVFLPQFA